MVTFAYSGRTRAGQTVSGERVADTLDGAVAALRREQILVTQINPVKDAAKAASPKTKSKGVSAKNLAVFTRQFSTMIDAGLPLVQCLDILGAQNDNPAFKKVIYDVKMTVETGTTFAEALKKHPKVFDTLFVNLVAAGETGGILDSIMNRLATYIEKNMKLVKQIKSALTYPTVVVVVSIAVVSALLLFVIPTFEKMFRDFGGTLPALTQAVIDMSRFAQAWAPVIFPVLIGAG